MLDLRRRVQADPASIAFAQLAEECRRLGNNEEAAEICRAGLARNPGYLSARVTLGRALIELGHLDAAKAELEIVVAGVPDNLAAIRGLAEILQRRGQMPEALQYYRRALELARHDPDLEDTVERISQAVTPTPAPQAPGPQVSIEEIFNFDTLIDQLGLPPEDPAPPTPAAPAFEDFFARLAAEPSVELSDILVEEAPSIPEETPADIFAEISSEPAAEPASAAEAVILSSADAELGFDAQETPLRLEEDTPVILEREPPGEDYFAAFAPESEGGPVIVAADPPMIEAVPGVLDAVELTLDDADGLAVMERELRELEQQREVEQQRAHDEHRARAELAHRRRTAMVAALETWLSAIMADRERHTA